MRELRALVALAQRVGVEVRVEPFAETARHRGGLCRIRGRRVILVDEKLGPVDRAGIIGLALGAIVPPNESPDDLVPYLRTGHGSIAKRSGPLRPLARARWRPESV